MTRSTRPETRFLSVVDQIHATAVGDRDWTSTLINAVDFIGGCCADLTFFDPLKQQGVRLEPAGLDTATLQKYLEVHSDLNLQNPRMPIYLGLAEGESMADSERWTRAQRDRHPFFAEVMYPGNMYDCLNSFVRKTMDGRPWVAFPVHFTRKHGPPDRENRLRLQMLLPHLRRAVAVEERMVSARGETAALAAVLDRVSEAAALIDVRGRIVRANERALKLLRAADGISLARDERLILSQPAARDGFARALAECASPLLLLDRRGAPPPAQVSVFRRDLRPLVLTFQALPQELKGAYGAVAMLFIADPDSRPADSTAALRAAYRLSGTEARLVHALSEGQSLREFAVSNTMSYETARSHVRRIFMKTGARRQSDLIRITRNLR